MHDLVERIAQKLAEERGEELGCDMEKVKGLTKNLIEKTVIKLVINQAFERAQFAVITDKTTLIKGGTLKLHLDNIVMAMQARARVIFFKAV